MSRRLSQSHRFWIPYFALAGTLLLTGLAAFATWRSSLDQERLQFENAVQRTEDDIHQRLDTYIALLKAGSGFFAASETVTRADFRAYIEQQQIPQQFPGIQGIGYTLRFGADQKNQVLRSLQQQGVSNFTLRPASARSEYHAIIYLEPLDRRNQAAIGYDMFTEPTRRAAMERARDTGLPAASGRVTLVQEIDPRKQAGFLIYVPIYRKGAPLQTISQRRAALTGFIYSPFRIDDLMQGILADKLRYVDFEIYDGAAATDRLMHRSSDSPPFAIVRFTQTIPLTVAGRTWNLVFMSRPELTEASGRGLVPYIVSAGVTIGLILFAITRSQTQALTRLEQTTTALQTSNQRLGFLYSTSSSLLLHEQPSEFLDSLFLELSNHLHFEVFLNYLLEPTQKKLRLNAYHGIPDTLASELQWVEMGDSISGTVAQDRRSILVEDVQYDATMKALRSQGITAYACYPLMSRGQLIGTISFGSRQRSQFDSDELALLQIVCDQVASAIERANLLVQLQQQTKELQETSRLKDEFLATLSHELRTPMNAIMGWTTLLQTRKFDEATVKRALETIDRNTKALNQLIEDILDVSRIINGKLKLKLQPVELVPLIQTAIEMVQATVDAKRIQIQTVLEPAIAPVLGDSTRIQQILWNLLSNAIKFTPEQGQVIVKLTQQHCEQGAIAQIQVIDSGQGIAPDFLPHVFDRFRQADGRTTRAHGGLGLGLAIVYHLVELHGGTIRAKSEGLGQGATFTVELPIWQRPQKNLAPDARPKISAPLVENSLEAVNVLVVDDEIDSCDVVAATLREFGANVSVAMSARQALEHLTQARPDILISDIGMPETDGYELIRQVRALCDPQVCNVPAIALTAYASADDRSHAIAAGFQAHLPKPINPPELVQMVAMLALQIHSKM